MVWGLSECTIRLHKYTAGQILGRNNQRCSKGPCCMYVAEGVHHDLYHIMENLPMVWLNTVCKPSLSRKDGLYS